MGEAMEEIAVDSEVAEAETEVDVHLSVADAAVTGDSICWGGAVRLFTSRPPCGEGK